MEESVECGECGYRYDSAKQAFCPRCGSESQERPLRSERYEPQRFDPRRRRAQAGGVILVAFSAVALFMSLSTAILAPEPADSDFDALAEVQILRDAPGGTLEIEVVGGNATLWLLSMDGEPLLNQTVDGSAQVDLPVAFSNATFVAGNDTWSWLLYIPEGESKTLTVDVASDEPQGGHWIAVKEVGAIRVMSGFIAFFAAFVLFAGILAIRLRHHKLAIAGAGFALVPPLFFLLVLPIAGFLMLVPMAVALLFIIQGRPHFVS